MEPGAVTPGNAMTPTPLDYEDQRFNGARGCNPWKPTVMR